MKKRWTRLFAVCLGLIVVLSACASVDVDAPSGESTATEESKETSALELSEVNAESTSSEAEPSTPEGHLSADDEASIPGDITITPIEPTYPEERETTLELVKEYPLGEGGIPFDILEGENPAYKKVDLPGWFFADEQGNLYAFTGTTIYDLQSGEKLELSHDGLLIFQLIAVEDMLYGLETDGRLNIYTMQDGKVGSVKYPERSKGGMIDLFVSPDGKPRVVVDGVFYDETGKKITGDCVIENVPKGEDTLGVCGRTYSFAEDFYVQSYADGVLTAYESISHRNNISLPDQSTGIENFYEYIVYQYDQNGDPLSEFMIYRYYDPQSIPCSILRDGLECTSYEPITISVGDRVFKNLLSSKWFVGADGTIYLLVIDPDGGELYKINPGYSDVEFTDFEADIKTELQQTATTSSTTVKHAKVSAEVAEQRAKAMADLIWTVQEENTYPLRTGAKLPTHLVGVTSGTQVGIPYCWGGYNGIDTKEYGVYRGKRFEDIITQEASDGRLYMTGNTESIIVANTVGLDCSGYACSAYGFASRTNTEGFVINHDYGHEVVGELQPMDLLVKANNHCYLYLDSVGGRLQVYDCTRENNTDKVSKRLIDVEDIEGYARLRLCYTYDPDASPNYHTYSCSKCGITDEEEPHTWSIAQDTSLWHKRVCTICGYEIEQTHAFTYVSNNSTTHKRLCNDCGFYTLHAHTLSYSTNAMTHRETCSVCGYLSPTEPHNYTYSYDTTKHWRKCRLCDYTTTKTLHTFDADGACTACPYSKGLIIMDEPELPQDNPEVPTDDFIVLCAEPKEELWERIQR